MSVTILTPPGTGAIATVAVTGSRAWEAVRAIFRPAKGTLPEQPPLHRVYFGTLGDGGDEVVVGVPQTEPEVVVEVHSHGGQRVVRWVVEQLEMSRDREGADEPESAPLRSGFAQDPRAVSSLTHAATLRVASVFLDQLHGAFARAVEAVLADLPKSLSQLHRLALLAPFGRRLSTPPRVVIAGPPNVGKSSLLNALAGFQRSIVSPTAGTTRDVVGVELAFDGWPVRVSDTAGLRDAGEHLEAAGIELAERELATADLVLWVMDQTDANPVPPPHDFGGRLVVVANKCDQPGEVAAGGMRVSAKTGEGLPVLIAEVVRRLFPVVPQPGEGVPFLPELCDAVERAAADPDRAKEFL
ncbi:MAG: 50S ribosome-binding GTPase [Fimbriiglobus sp.]|jgi:tRNA modification GTPase|nr:50S ribosome-binding GTPase [Fimbriiglobus sp.]